MSVVSPSLKPAKKDKSFWMVQGSQKRAARCRHASFESALAEAERLANLNPGRTYWVLRSVSAVTVPNPLPVV